MHALSRLDIIDTNNLIEHDMSSLAELFSLEKYDVLHPDTNMQYQQKDKPLIETAKSNKDYSIKHFHGVYKIYSLMYRKHNIVIPKLLGKQVVEWYHNVLCYPGEVCTELSIAQHFYWKILRKNVYNVCSKCKASQTIQKSTTEGGRKQTSGYIMCRLIGQYQFTPKGRGKKYQMTTKNKKIVY